jgi:DNA-binding response OmpR family regulator
MKEINILIVEDESIVAMEIKSYIKKLGYTVVDICSNAKDAFTVVSEHNIDIILMDICIKGELDGAETAALIKKSHPHTEIIFLTAHLDDYNVDRAIEINPTAYLSKPFNREELRVFLKIALRRIDKEPVLCEEYKHHIILNNEFSYDPSNHTLYCCYAIIHLTKKECELLELLIENKNNIVDFYTIENNIWPDKDTNTNTIRTLVKRLRQKLKHTFIETVSSRGYRLMIPAITIENGLKV